MGSTERCPCGSGQAYTACCEPYLAGRRLPDRPEALMRSRYTAFAKGAVAYLIATQHPSQRRPDDDQQLRASIADTTWLSLRLLLTPPVRGDKGIVEFVAFYRSQGTLGQLHERSNFARNAGQWYYVDGLHLPPIALGRNDPCWCGSGRKMKQCHGR